MTIEGEIPTELRRTITAIVEFCKELPRKKNADGNGVLRDFADAG